MLKYERRMEKKIDLEPPLVEVEEKVPH